MSFSNHFSPEILEQTLARLDKLSVDTPAQWGKMDAAQMLAHVNIAYDLAYGRKGEKHGALKKWLLRKFVKPIVTGDTPYKPNSKTAPVFVVTDRRDFNTEKKKLIDNLHTTISKGEEYFEGKESASFGIMSAREWSQQFQKHIEHHFKQFDI